MPRRPMHHDFRKGGFVSLWLDDALTSEDEHTYLRGQFQSEFGFAIDPRDGPESDVSEVPREVDDVLEGFSRSATFRAQAVDAARLMGWERATAALVFYIFKYGSDHDRSADDSPIRFVGVFRYLGFG